MVSLFFLIVVYLLKNTIFFFLIRIASLTRGLIKQRRENEGENYNDFLELFINILKEKNLDVKEEEIIGNSVSFCFQNVN